MKQSMQTTLASMLLSLLIVVLLSYSDWERWFETDTVTASEEEQPDLVALSVQQVRYNEKGEKHYLLVADKMLQFLDTNRNHMVRPDITLFRLQESAWKTTADEASSDATGDELHLRGNVMVRQQSEQGAVMETTALVLYPKTSQAHTDAKVIIRQQGIHIEALGLDADLTTNKLTLKHQVTSIYEPEKS